MTKIEKILKILRRMIAFLASQSNFSIRNIFSIIDQKNIDIATLELDQQLILRNS